MAFSISTMLCNPQHYLIPEHFHQLLLPEKKKNTMSLAVKADAFFHFSPPFSGPREGPAQHRLKLGFWIIFASSWEDQGGGHVAICAGQREEEGCTGRWGSKPCLPGLTTNHLPMGKGRRLHTEQWRHLPQLLTLQDPWGVTP